MGVAVLRVESSPQKIYETINCRRIPKYISRAPKEPLIRIRLVLNHQRFNSFHVASFAKRYKGRIANTDIILFKRMSRTNRGKFLNFFVTLIGQLKLTKILSKGKFDSNGRRREKSNDKR